MEINNDGSLDIFGQHFSNKQVRKVGNNLIIDGSKGVVYTNIPNLKNKEDLYYSGCGCTWDIDLDGNRYYKLNRKTGKIYNDEARLEKEIQNILNEK